MSDIQPEKPVQTPTRIKQIDIKVLLPRKRAFKKAVRSPNGKVFTEQGIDNVLEQVAGNIERAHPGFEFRMVQVGKAAYNFVFAGVKQEIIDNALAAVQGKTA